MIEMHAKNRQGTTPLFGATNEWDPLLEIVVGDVGPPLGLTEIDIEDPGFWLFYFDNLSEPLKERIRMKLPVEPHKGRFGPQLVNSRYVAERREDLDGLCDVLTSCGVKVRRPEFCNRIERIKRRTWQSIIHPAHNVRDLCFVHGDFLIETPPMLRMRLHENEFLYDLFSEYSRRGAKWIVAPRPRLLQESFDRSYQEGNPIAQRSEQQDVQYEMMFDGAQALRFGTDILMNISNYNHLLGARWLSRQLAGQADVHVVYRLADNHIDGSFLPLRPGKLLVNSKAVTACRQLLPPPLQRWDWIICEDVDDSSYPDGAFLPASEFISGNVLSVDPKTVIVERRLHNLIFALESHGFEVIPVPLRHSRVFAGGFHCVTLDVSRDHRGGVGGWND